MADKQNKEITEDSIPQALIESFIIFIVCWIMIIGTIFSFFLRVTLEK